jgi:predicted nucleotidyltransferase
MKSDFNAFISDLRATHGKNLASVILYGSAAAGDFVNETSDYNILVALDKIGPSDLRNAHPCIREWVRMGHPVPVYFTVSELRNAADVFPIEFSALEVARKVLYGKDVLADLEFSDENLRHQTEYELRSKLIGLRRAYIPASGSAAALSRLMADSLPSVVTLFRAALMLFEIDTSTNKRGIVARAAEHFGIDGTPFEKIINIRKNNFTEELDEIGANNLFADYLEQLEKVIDAVDAAGEK